MKGNTEMTNLLPFAPFTVTLDRGELLAALESTSPMVDKDKYAAHPSLRNVALAVLDDNGNRTLVTAATNRYYVGRYVAEHDSLEVEGEGDSNLELTPDGVKSMIAALKQTKLTYPATLTVNEGEITLEVAGTVVKLMEGTAWNKADQALGVRKLGKLFDGVADEATKAAYNPEYLTTILKAAKNGVRAKHGAKEAKTTPVIMTTDVTKPGYFTVDSSVMGWDAMLMPVRMPGEVVRK